MVLDLITISHETRKRKATAHLAATARILQAATARILQAATAMIPFLVLSPSTSTLTKPMSRSSSLEPTLSLLKCKPSLLKTTPSLLNHQAPIQTTCLRGRRRRPIKSTTGLSVLLTGAVVRAALWTRWRRAMTGGIRRRRRRRLRRIPRFNHLWREEGLLKVLFMSIIFRRLSSCLLLR